MRTFIAIELPQEIKNVLAGVQEKLRKSGADVKWVKPENIHLTLKFLGDRDNKKIEKMIEIIEETAKNKNSFRIRISSLGAFPRIDYPSIIWVGVDKGDDKIKEIAQELEEKIARVGIPKETRPFSSHITIGRAKSTLNRERLTQGLNNLAENFGQENLEFDAAKITLFKSTLTPQGPIYEALKEANLKTT